MLQRFRGAGGMGPSPLTGADFRDFQANYGVRLTPWQIDVCKRLDLAELAAQVNADA